MPEGPGDHVAQRVPGRGFLGGDSADAGNDLLGLVELPDRLAAGDVAQARSEAHAVDEGDSVLQSL